MYKLLLCWRYLRTRYIALASIISVMLGVATMIVVNSVMGGFTTEMQNRLHGVLSDIVFEQPGLEGFPDADWHMEQIRRVAGDSIAGMTPTVSVPALLQFQVHRTWVTQQVMLIGIDERTQSQVSDFGRYLQHPANRQEMSFELRQEGYDARDHQAGPEAPERREMRRAGWTVRREKAFEQHFFQSPPAAPDPLAIAAANAAGPADPFLKMRSEAETFDPARQQHTGIVLGIALCSHRDKDGQDRFLVLPGDDVIVHVPSAGTSPKPIHDAFTIVDFYESKMSVYDASFVFVPIRKLQEMRNMVDPTSGVRLVTSIQIKLKPGADLDAVRDRLREKLGSELFGVYTWRDKQDSLLAAVQMETAILNVLLFMIIAVAGFGILAVFFMIVVEKTRDIGILKSLGAPGMGIMGIFLAYGLSLGLVGSGVGLAIGLAFVKNINAIANVLASVTGQKVFDPSIYYFYSIPTVIQPWTIAWIVIGAVTIAVAASILPALRAATLHPVEALRYE
jgi:lipoprotein-releasing system permease protein